MVNVSEWQGKLRVRLLVDLTQYHSTLEDGAEGIVVDFLGQKNDCFWQVRFPV